MIHCHCEPDFRRFGAALLGAVSLLACSASSAPGVNPRGTSGANGASSSVGDNGGAPSNVGGGVSNGGSLSLNTGGTSTNPDGGIADSCASDTHQAAAIPVTLFVLLDQSGSMTQDGDRWSPVTSALKAFVNDMAQAGLNVGLQYFPLGATTTDDPQICAVQNYVTPDVPIAALPGNAAAFAASIDKHYFTAAQANDPAHWGTPTAPALAGAYQYLASYLQMHPDQHGVLLLATDGLPSNLCTGDKPAQVTTQIGAQVTQMPSIETYVVGIGQVSNLSDWAMAGGTGHDAFIVDGTGTTTGQDLGNALGEIRKLTLPCDYLIPTPDAGTIDPQKVNVRVTLPNMMQSQIANVASASACDATTPTWYYDNPTAPTRVELCPSACSELGQTGTQIELLFGCQTEVFVPK
ncbi:MAG TPA: vWA domain-containing protein [Polyangiaceae bacterium]|jgi:hypothetical protein|nr:vWA domain-containing protein [Polyangiaceae bacterium]